eukprot:6191997-Pleurochrysis_carterae.AAC.2
MYNIPKRAVGQPSALIFCVSLPVFTRRGFRFPKRTALAKFAQGEIAKYSALKKKALSEGDNALTSQQLQVASHARFHKLHLSELLHGHVMTASGVVRGNSSPSERFRYSSSALSQTRRAERAVLSAPC